MIILDGLAKQSFHFPDLSLDVIHYFVSQKILLVSPPFTQLNTPYPATAYLKGYLNTQKMESVQVDLGMDTILKIFSQEGLTKIFQSVNTTDFTLSPNAQRIYALRDRYSTTIDAVIGFLQDRDPSLSYYIAERKLLPEASKFEQLVDLEWAFGTMGLRDKARHIATLYLEDISDFIVEVIDPNFGFSRYAERLGLSAHSFDELYAALHQPLNPITEVIISLLDQTITAHHPTLVCFSVPFPGNLFASLKCGQWLKQNYPEINVVMGGGYPNTELRSLSDPRVFEFVDFICLDDGETPLVTLTAYLDGTIGAEMLKRTFMLDRGDVKYCNGSLLPDVRQEHAGTPDYDGLSLKNYLSVIQLTNPMHRLWSDGRWNKLTMAHGCYWGKCTFCDISLDYIKNYEASSASLIVDRMETMLAQTGESGFHFVDEAAPPALMKAVAIEILRRKLVVSWWTNIRFEKSFHYDLCRLLSASGCIAISGGLEVASDRLLKLIAKGVTVEQVTKVNDHFKRAGIMVHAYLMYGFPTQTDQETVDSLEVVRQMFDADILQSAFWHRFAMTAHSPVGMYPEQFEVVSLTNDKGRFANNDLSHLDPNGGHHDLYQGGLKKSLYNYMHGIGLDFPLQEWFDHPIPKTSLPGALISGYLEKANGREMKDSHLLYWIGGPVTYHSEKAELHITTNWESILIPTQNNEGLWLERILAVVSSDSEHVMSYHDLRIDYDEHKLGDFTLFWYGDLMEKIKEVGLLVL